MSGDQIIHVVGVIGGVVVTIFTTLYGFHAVSRNFRIELADAVRGKVDVTIYSAKVKELHDLRNADREELVALKTEVRILREREVKHGHG